MKFCTAHWEQLRTRIYEGGVSDQIAKDGKEAVQRAKSGTFDPLMAANNAISSRALDEGGLVLMQPNEDGSEKCPICYLDAAHKAGCSDPDCTGSYEGSWIPGAADEAIAQAIRLRTLEVTE